MTDSARMLSGGWIFICLILAGCTSGTGFYHQDKPLVARVAGNTAGMEKGASASSVSLPVPTKLMPGRAVSAEPEFERCRAELTSLSLINQEAYVQRHTQFERLVTNAAVYARVRTQVNQQAQETLDALYQFKTRQLCLRIGQDVSDGLMRRAETLTRNE